MLILPWSDGALKMYVPTGMRLWRLHYPNSYPCKSPACVICACSECGLPIEWGCGHAE